MKTALFVCVALITGLTGGATRATGSSPRPNVLFILCDDLRPDAVRNFENMVHASCGTVLSVDESVGRLAGHLRETGEWENTCVVFMGDNGLLEGEHGMVDKRTMHEPMPIDEGIQTALPDAKIR